MEPPTDKPKPTDTGTWRQRLADALNEHAAEERRVWGDTDDVPLARYACGVCTDEERRRVEQAKQQFPAVRECLDMALQTKPSSPGENEGAQDRGGRSRADESRRSDKGPHPAR